MKNFTTLPEAMSYASSCKCMWSYVDGKPYPLWFMVDSLKPDLHVLAYINSAAGRIAPCSWVGYARSECPSDLASQIRMALCRPESFYGRCYELREFDLSLVSVQRRHTYKYELRTKTYKGGTNLFPGDFPAL